MTLTNHEKYLIADWAEVQLLEREYLSAALAKALTKLAAEFNKDAGTVRVEVITEYEGAPK